MERKEAMLKKKCSRFFCAVMAFLLCAAPGVLAEDIDYDVPGGLLDVYGTVNLLPGANVDYAVSVYPNGVLNVYAGTVGFLGITLYAPTPEFPGSNPVVTVHGTNFGGGGDFSVPGQVSFSTGSGILTVTYTDDNGDPIGDPVSLLFLSDIPINLVDTAGGPEPEPITVEIDIKPGSDPNPINQGSNGVIPVAILTTDSFDASTVDPGTVTLAGAEVAVRGKSEKLMARLEDVDGDGDDDLMLQVDTQSEGAVWEAGSVILLGTTYEGQAIEGTDSVVIVPPE